MAMITTQLSSAQCFKLAAQCGVHVAQADTLLTLTPAQLVRMLQIAFQHGAASDLMQLKYKEPNNVTG